MIYFPELSHFFAWTRSYFDFFLGGGVGGGVGVLASAPLHALPTSLCAYGHIISREVKKVSNVRTLFKQIFIHKS